MHAAVPGGFLWSPDWLPPVLYEPLLRLADRMD